MSAEEIVEDEEEQRDRRLPEAKEDTPLLPLKSGWGCMWRGHHPKTKNVGPTQTTAQKGHNGDKPHVDRFLLFQ